MDKRLKKYPVAKGPIEALTGQLVKAISRLAGNLDDNGSQVQ
jgi:hypothetical protein